ncbi:hypothetical protein KVR01_001605 [Diaporthe batatas]|uniref:uncharacterized protein n=1 Tax=Diaporthe batatas TaxID=748121 RepID=UPI001D05C169|nr:uncharacterized protein KVR01_001605 [Diaporthe batatas]KAG8168856.1 hypothetical protein KVR01_001605 [Diaporthe batatas]
MTSSHPQDGPSGHLSTPQPHPEPQSQSQPQAESRPQPAAGPPPTSNAPSPTEPLHTTHPDDAITIANQEISPPRNLPPSSDPPANPVQPSAPTSDEAPPRRHADHDQETTSADLVHNWLNKTDEQPPQPDQPSTAPFVAPQEGPAAAAAAAATADDAASVDPRAVNGLSSDFANPHVPMLEQDMPQAFMDGQHYLGPMYLPWQFQDPTFKLEPMAFHPGVSVHGAADPGISDDDDAASLDQPELDGACFDRMARLEFSDSYVEITTNTTIIGRDQRVYKKALRDKRIAEEGGNVSGVVPQKRGHYSRSYVSQEGGALGPESDDEGRSRSSKRRRILDDSFDALPPRAGSPSADDHPVRDKVISSRQYLIDHTPGAVPVDMENLRPSSDDIARIDIHGAGPNIIETSKGISRDHLKIQYDEENRLWKATAIGRNGFFCDDVLYRRDDVVTLRSGADLQIQGVGFIFTIHGVEDGKFGNEEPRAYYEGDKKMSLDFSNSRCESDMRDTDDEESPPAKNPNVTLDSDDSDDSDADADKSAVPKPGVNGGLPKAQPEEPIRPTIESDSVKDTTQPVGPDAPQAMVPPKKRGPGRPPKNGVMSKREERELKKKREEEDKKNNPPQEMGEPPIKRKVGRPRKHPRPEDEGDQPEKRKYKPRKPKNEDGDEEEDPEGDKTDKQKRLQKPKTPPLDLGKRADWPEEKLQKPNKNYQMLIDEVLTAAPDGLTLKQIYKRIAMAYPHFHFCVDTKGWESSVRHNLIGSLCFEKNQETHLWKRVPGIPLESGKKRKPSDTTADLRPHQPMYNAPFNATHNYQQPPPPQQFPNQQIVPAGGGPQMNGFSHHLHNNAQHALTGRLGQGPSAPSQRAPTMVHSGPAVESSLREFLDKFSKEVVKQLQGRVKRPRAVAVSVINRGLGLTDMSLAPEHENFEKAIINIFHTHKLTYSKPKTIAASTAVKEAARPQATPTAPTVNGNASAPGSASAALSPVPATLTSAPDGSGPSGSNPTVTAPNSSGTPASQANGSLAATASTQNATTTGVNLGLGHNNSSATGPASAGPSAPSALAPTHLPGAGNQSGSPNSVQPTSVPSVPSPVPHRSSATPATGTPTPDVDNAQLLDPKLVDVIKQYKELSQQVLKPQLGPLHAEILVMSAVNRVLGFTEETIVPQTAQNTKLGLKEAEDALMNSLRPRIDSYLRSKQAPATPTPAPVHGATTTSALPL